jgi:scyllo-inositol 2-dehydrogenase (NADP+)
MSRYTVGVAGCGSIATERHIPAVQANDSTELVSVYDHKYPNAERAASKFDVEGAYDDFDAFLETVDIITIATPPFVHADLSVAALESGTHVLCEKPMAVEKADAKRMLQADREHDARLGLVHNFLFSHSMRRAKRLVDQGAVGNVQYVKGFQVSSPSRGLPSWYTDLPYDLFFDEAPHFLYLMEHFIGQPQPKHVETQFRDDQLHSLTTTLAGDEDRIGQLTMHFNAPLSEWYLFIIGDRKIIVVDIFRDILYEFGRETSHSATEVLMVSMSAVRQILSGVAKSGIRLLRDDLYFGFNELLDRYIHALQYGTDLPVSAADGYRVFESAYDIIDFET